MTGDHESVTAVVALAAGDHDLAGHAQRLEEPRRARPRIFHQHDARNAQVFDRSTIDLSHLGPRQ
jgi:hypothetical protein